MNIAILSRGAQLYSTKSLFNAADLRNHDVAIIDPTHCILSIEDGQPLVHYFGDVVDDLHAIIPRIGASNTYFGAAVVRHFEAQGVFSTVSSESIITSRDKWTCFQLLSQARIPTPMTILGSSWEPEDILADWNSYPVIIKLLKGTHGQGVILAESKQSALSTLETLNSLGARYVLQEYIAESKGTDLRAIVVGGRVVAAMKRQSKDGDFRSNLHRGASAVAVKLDYKQEALAIKAAKTLGLGACGVDILPSSRGPLVLEINSTPGLEGIENTTGIDVAKHFISYIERNKG